jgi:hypothetical protein
MLVVCVRIEEEKVVTSASSGSVEPSVEFEAHSVCGDVTHVDDDVFPLAALSFVASYGVSIFYL